nr:glutamate-5-semialdehyde dehydrogenase [bacterium]
MPSVREEALLARTAAPKLAIAGIEEKNQALLAMADALEAGCPDVLKANVLDMEAAAQNGMPQSMQDRLRLDEKRVAGMAQGIRQVAQLPDPIGKVESAWVRPNGLRIAKMRVPLGVIGMIYEARPNVTSDSAALCIKSGNAVVLRGGSEAIHSNRAIVETLRAALKKTALPEDAIVLLSDPSRQAAAEMMALHGIIDVLIPRGGAGLIRSVVEQARVPVIETGTGVCHTYVDAGADLDMALQVVLNAKMSRPSVCNAMETLLVDERVAEAFLPMAVQALHQAGCEVRGCTRTLALCPDCIAATEADWDCEYNDTILSIRVVDGLEGALSHIAQHSTRHSEAIITRDYGRAERFLNQVDAAAVYVNASTRFTDGGEFGFGAEIGISTQKLHARGPVGLEQLTTNKYVIRGDGQIR